VSGATDALGTALAAEHAAVFGYGVVGAHLDKTGQDVARQAETVHRGRRDTLVELLTTENATVPAAAPAYALPFPVVDRAGAMRLAVTLEDGCAQAWRAALGATSGEQRKLVLDALVDCAVRGTRWRRTAGILPTTLTFPGTVK
jgi:hypothetical protein